MGARSVNYKHPPCGKVVGPTAVTPGIDPRFAMGRCRFCSTTPVNVVWVATTDPTEEEAREVGEARAASVTLDWQEAARRYVASLSLGVRLTSDHVTQAVGVPPSPGAVGALFSGLAKRHVVHHVGFTKSVRPGRHNGLIREWERTA